jgi:hypothetical protein
VARRDLLSEREMKAALSTGLREAGRREIYTDRANIFL